ncbi:BlaI/MecI/CopY family transcriptional regulator [Micromonospora sp. CPCC 206061]
MRGFGELESAVMEWLWDKGEPATVRQVHTVLCERRELAYTTVLTVMDNLYKKGWLRREPAGRAHRYEPVANREQYGAQLMREALDASGDREQALLNFVGRMSLEEAVALRQALSTYERKISGK